MGLRLSPDYFASSVLDIEPSFLKRLADVVVLDLDNTIVPRDGKAIERPYADWVRSLQDAGLDIVIVSNNWRARVEEALRGVGEFDIVAPAGKPLLRNLRAALARRGHTARRAVLIGDQVFTDILGARRLGLTAILVSPLSDYDLPHTRALRVVERLLLKRWLRCGACARLGA